MTTWTNQSPILASWTESRPNSNSWDSSNPTIYSRLLQEDGSFLLQENLFYILLNNYEWSSILQNSGGFIEVSPTNTLWSQSNPN